MTTATNIVTAAYQLSNIVGIDASPTSNEATWGLARLNNYIDSLFGKVLGEHLADWPVPPSRTDTTDARYPLKPLDEDLPSDVWSRPPPNSRLIVKITSATTVYFPASPSDGARIAIADAGSTAAINLTLDGNGKTIAGSATATIVPATTTEREYIYRADLGDWQVRSTLTGGDEMPFPLEFDELFISGLSMMLSAQHGLDVHPFIIQRNNEMRGKMKTQYRQHMPKGGNFDPRMHSRQAHGTLYTTDRDLYS